MNEEKFDSSDVSCDKLKEKKIKQLGERYQLYYYNKNSIQDTKLIYIE